MSAGAVLLISRGTMSGGGLIAECLTRHTGIPCLTREDLLATVNSFGDLASRVASCMANAAEAYDEFSQLRRPYRILMKQALLQHAREGSLAYLGYSGHLLVERVRHFIRVRLIASTELRIAMTERRCGYSEAEAKAYIARADQERARWARWMYGVDIRDPVLYDLSLNLDRLYTEGACRLLYDAMQDPVFQPTPESIAQVENDYLATRALAALLTPPETANLDISATQAGGVLHLVGPYISGGVLRAVEAAAGALEGIDKVEYEPGYATALL